MRIPDVAKRALATIVSGIISAVVTLSVVRVINWLLAQYVMTHQEHFMSLGELVGLSVLILLGILSFMGSYAMTRAYVGRALLGRTTYMRIAVESVLIFVLFTLVLAFKQLTL